MTKYVCALDIDTSKVCALLTDLNEEKIITVASTWARGTNKQGEVTDSNDLSDAIAEVIAKLEEKSRFRIKDIYVSISGSHIESRNVRGGVIISEQGRGISKYDVEKAIDFTKNISLPLERKIVHTIIQDYIIDGQGGITNPLNLYGHKLEVNLHLVTTSREEIEKLTKAINCAGLKVKELLPSAILPQDLTPDQHPDIPALDYPSYAGSLALIQYGINKEKQQKGVLMSLHKEFNKITHRTKKIFSTYF